MGVRGVWYSQDRRWRVELVSDRGRQFFRVIDRTLPTAQLPSVDALEAWLHEHANLSFADFVED